MVGGDFQEINFPLMQKQIGAKLFTKSDADAEFWKIF